MASSWRSFWRDERGGTEFVTLVFVTAVVAIGGVVGLVQIRDQVTQEFGDIGVALDNIDQSFSYTISVDGNGDGDFVDPVDFVLTASNSDNAATLMDDADMAPACLTLNVVSPTSEGGALPAPTGDFP